jgi:hypothetical protein
MAASRSDNSGGLAMLDVIVLIAMAVTAAAFAVGLILHSGIAQIPALIASAALYMVMAASYLMVARTPKSGGGGSDRLNELEAALEVIDKDLQRIDKVEDDVSRLDLLTDRIDRLDQAVSDYGAGDRGSGVSRFAGVSQEIEAVHAKIENLARQDRGRAQGARSHDQAIVARSGRCPRCDRGPGGGSCGVGGSLCRDQEDRARFG